MDTEKMEQIKKIALINGFTDARAASWGEGSVLVLFANYMPIHEMNPCRIGMSAYYVASNRGYKNALAVEEALIAIGIRAKRDTTLPAQQAALACGGWIGKNGFYYHPEFGSLVHIQTIVLEDKIECAQFSSQAKCSDCSICIAACPAGAITESGADYSRCLRNHMNGVIPDELKPYIYQLYGCEKCQTACPINKKADTTVKTFDLEETIKGQTLSELQRLAGKNIARTVRTINQAILYAANVGNTSVGPVVLELAHDVRFADACRYYLEAQKKKD